MLIVALAVAAVFVIRWLDGGRIAEGVIQESSKSSPGWVGSQAPEFMLQSLDGSVIDLKDLRGRAVVLNFWATWCVPCRAEMPALQDAYSEQQDQNLVVLAINMEEGEKQVKEYVNELKLTFPVVLDKDGSVGRLYTLLGLPSSFFVDRNGAIRAISFGSINRSAIDRRIDTALHID